MEKFKVETEQEFYRITTALKELDIPFSVKKFKDVNFPVLAQPFGYAEISVDASFKETVQQIIEAKVDADLVFNESESIKSESKPAKKLDLLKIALIIYSVGATYFAWKYWDIVKDAENIKLFSYEWNYDNTILTTIYNKTGAVTEKAKDLNKDSNFEMITTYDKNGIILSKSFDNDEDGFFEEVYVYNKANEQVWKSMDENKDGKMDRDEIILENKDTLVLVDKNANGYAEIEK